MRQTGGRTLPPGAGLAIGRSRARPTAAPHGRPTHAPATDARATDAAAAVSAGADHATPATTATCRTLFSTCRTLYSAGGTLLSTCRSVFPTRCSVYSADNTLFSARYTESPVGSAPVHVAAGAVGTAPRGDSCAARRHAAGPASSSNADGSAITRRRCAPSLYAWPSGNARRAAAGAGAAQPARGGQTGPPASQLAAATAQTQAATETTLAAATVTAGIVRLGLAARAPLCR
jgi:hypothetical protein